MLILEEMKMITNKIDELSDVELISKVHKAIIEQFGINGYIRYIRLQYPNVDGQDYLKEQDYVFKDMSLEEIYSHTVELHDRTHT